MNDITSPHRARLETLGRARLPGQAGELLPEGRKELALLAYLARRSPAAVGRGELAALFWEERDETRARQSLRQALVKLRRAVGEGFETTADRVRLRQDSLTLDAAEFEAAVRADRLEEAVALWRGDFLAGMEEAGGEGYRAWLEAEREALRRRLASALEGLAAEAGARGAWRESADWAERWAEARPLDEAAYRALVEALQRAGRAEEARHHHAAFVARLRGELDASPSDGFLRLGAEIEPAAERPRPHRVPGAAALFTPSLVGRDAELGGLAAAWRQAREGGSGAVVVEGEEGVGKSRLCEEFLRGLRAAGKELLLCRARGGEALHGPPPEALRVLLAPLAIAPGLGGAADAALARLAQFVPDIRLRFPQLPATAVAHPVAPEVIREVLAAVAAEVPVLLFLDDFPAVDDASRQSVLALARDLPAGVLLLLTGRPRDLETSGTSGALRDLPGTRRYKLRPLRPAEVEALVGSMLELAESDRRALAARLHAEAAGSPFLTVEMVAMLADTGHILLDEEGRWRTSLEHEERPLPVPTSVRELVASRVERLDENGRRVLEAAAVVGGPVDPQRLAAATGLPAEQLANALDELVSRRFLRESQAAPGSYEFVHALVQRVVRERLDPASRQTLRAPAPAAVVDARAGATHPPLRRGRRVRLAAAAVAVVLVLAGVAGLSRQRTPAAPLASPTQIAVLPFAVQGSSAYAYLGEGMVDLLSARLDGAGSLRSVDPRAILSQLRVGRDEGLDAAQAQRLAHRLGAGFYVLGSVVEAGGRLQISATLYDHSGAARAVVHTEAADEARLFDLVDEAARQLLAAYYPNPHANTARLAALTTNSLEALKAYLQGENSMRRGQFGAALGEFARAIEWDSTFALAHFRYALAAEWAARPDLLREAASRAHRHGAHLPRRERMFLDAYAAQVRGEAAEAEARYRSLLTDYPNDRDGWFMLGEVIFHLAPGTGRPLRDAQPAFRRVLELDPSHEEAIVHLVRIAAGEGDRAQVDSLMAQLEWILGSSVDVGVLIRAVHASVRQDRPALHAIRAHLAQSAPIIGMIAGSHLTLYTGDLEGAAAMAGILISPAQPPEVRGAGHVFRAHLHLARGRWREANADLAQAENLNPTLGLQYRALLLAAPWLPAPQAELERVLLRLKRSTVEERTPMGLDIPRVTLHPGLDAALRLYVAGLLNVRLGRSSEAERLAAEMVSVRAATPEGEALLHDLAWGLRARSALHAGDLPAAAHAESAVRYHVWYQYAMLSAFFARSQERYLRAELLARQGREEEAIRAFAAFDAFAFPDVAHLAPSHLRRGEIHERRGERHRALEHYRRFLDMWKDADPELQPLLREVEGRVARLYAGGR